MFNAKLLELNEREVQNYFNYDPLHTQNDSFSSGSDLEDSYKPVHKRRNRKINPHRSIPNEFALTNDDKAKAGIFVVDPFHIHYNDQFLQSFAKHHHILPSIKELNNLTPDMSHMGFTTGSSSEDENRHFDWEQESVDRDQPQSSKKSRNSRATGGGSNKKARRSSISTSSGVNSSSSSAAAAAANKTKIVNSSSLPRPADNSDKFPINLSPEMVSKLATKVNNNYKTYPLIHRHGSTPMDISSCPGVQLLTEDEYINCSLLRIRPALYFHARNTLLHNYHHSVGYFRKSAAQKMLRIDVNKTGKLYDFMVRQQWLPEVESGECKAEPEQVIVNDPETYHQL